MVVDVPAANYGAVKVNGFQVVENVKNRSVPLYNKARFIRDAKASREANKAWETTFRFMIQVFDHAFILDQDVPQTQ